ncbi:TPA: hypothetical protein ACKP43_005919, partial [Pseudomonas aeruginosa]
MLDSSFRLHERFRNDKNPRRDAIAILEEHPSSNQRFPKVLLAPPQLSPIQPGLPPKLGNGQQVQEAGVVLITQRWSMSHSQLDLLSEIAPVRYSRRRKHGTTRYWETIDRKLPFDAPGCRVELLLALV